MLFKYYQKNVLLTCGLVFASAVAYYIIDQILDVYRRSNGQWFIMKISFPNVMVIVMINALVTGLLSFPLFLNKYSAIRFNPVWSALSWFGLPVTLIVIESVWYRSEFHYYLSGPNSPGITDTLNILSCLAGLALPYLQFRKKDVLPIKIKETINAEQRKPLA